MAGEVWIVQHDESADNTVLGVFGSLDAAEAFAEEVADRFVNGVLYSSYIVGYRYDRGPGHVEFGPGSTDSAN